MSRKQSEKQTKERVAKFGEVFTPPHIVAQMCDMLEAESPGCFEPQKTFLEPSCGDGAFVLEILRRKFNRCRTRKDYAAALDSVYAFEIQADNVEDCIENVINLCKEYFEPTRAERELIEDHVIQCDGLKVMKLLARWKEEDADVDYKQ